jgi:hypothetical protein
MGYFLININTKKQREKGVEEEDKRITDKS